MGQLTLTPQESFEKLASWTGKRGRRNCKSTQSKKAGKQFSRSRLAHSLHNPELLGRLSRFEFNAARSAAGTGRGCWPGGW